MGLLILSAEDVPVAAEEELFTRKSLEQSPVLMRMSLQPPLNPPALPGLYILHFSPTEGNNEFFPCEGRL